ncbi:hypothetical protein [Bradyrhizobium sp. SK17]|uniref:hypothetical protein n=1 Tax=Bradyrhizobium sp. SK17 TaxID=2057741 RepID=UPI0012FD5E52|nr:hypothetical protein [Bradyrhizobium sp. SK17]
MLRAKCHDQSILRAAEEAFDLVESTTKGRNDFVHAIFATSMGKYVSAWRWSERHEAPESEAERRHRSAHPRYQKEATSL